MRRPGLRMLNNLPKISMSGMSRAGAQNQFFQFKILNHSHHGCLLMWCELGSAEKHAMKNAFPRQGRVQWEKRRASIRPVLHPQGCRAPGDGGRHAGTTLLRELEFMWPVQKRAQEQARRGWGQSRAGAKYTPVF